MGTLSISNTVLNAYASYATRVSDSGGNLKKSIALFQTAGGRTHSVSAVVTNTQDAVHTFHVGQGDNNKLTRAHFFAALCDELGIRNENGEKVTYDQLVNASSGEYRRLAEKLPPSVRAVVNIDDYGGRKPLSAYRISQVVDTVKIHKVTPAGVAFGKAVAAMGGGWKATEAQVAAMENMLDLLQGENGSLRNLAKIVQKASNAELKTMYAELQSEAFADYRDTLSIGQRGVLMDMEALIVSETSRRLTVSTAKALLDSLKAGGDDPEKRAKLRNVLSDFFRGQGVKDEYVDSFFGMPFGEEAFKAVEKAIEFVPTLEESYGGQAQSDSLPVKTRGGASDSSAAGLATVMETVARSATRAENRFVNVPANHPPKEMTLEEEVQELMDKSTEKMEKMTPRELKNFGDLLRSQDLTMNLQYKYIFGDPADLDVPGNSLLSEKEGYHLKNLFMIHDPDKMKGDVGFDYRSEIEDRFFPALQGDYQGKTRPFYAALNTSSGMSGNLESYGSVRLVLKDEVKKTATYTLGDTFHHGKIRFGFEGEECAKVEQRVIDDLKRYKNSLSIRTLRDLDNPNSEFRVALRKLLQSKDEMPLRVLNKRTENETISMLPKRPADFLMLKAHAKDMNSHYILTNSILRSVNDKGRISLAENPVDFDHIENLVDEMSGAVKHKSKVFAEESQKRKIGFDYAADKIEYVEAQIHKPLDLYKDIKSVIIHSPGQSLGTTNDEILRKRKQALRDWGARHGIEVFFDDERNAPIPEDGIYYSMKKYHNTRIASAFRRCLTEDKVKELEATVFNGMSAERREILQTTLGQQGLFDKLYAGIEDCIAKETPKITVDTRRAKDVMAAIDARLVSRLTAKAQELLVEQIVGGDAFKQLNDTQRQSAVAFLRKSEELLNTFKAGGKAYQVAPQIHSVLEKLRETGLSEDLAVKLIQAQINDVLGEEDLRRIVGSKAYGYFHLSLVSLDAALANIDLATIGNVPGVANAKSVGVLKKVMGELNQKLQLPEPAPLEWAKIPQFKRSQMLDSLQLPWAVTDKLPQSPERQLGEIVRPQAPQNLPKGIGGTRKFLIKSLSWYNEHEKDFDEFDEHGRTHATRVFIFAHVLSNILKEKGVKVSSETVALMAAGHDSGREGNVEDVFEDVSGAKTKKLLMDDYGLDEDYGDSVSESIMSNDDSCETVEAYLLHSADYLDFWRCAPMKKEKFPFLRENLNVNGTMLKIQGDGADKELQEIREALMKESKELTLLTHEMAKLKHYSGQDGENEFDDRTTNGLDQRWAERMDRSDEEVVSSIERVIRENKEKFPLLNKYYIGVLDKEEGGVANAGV